MEGGIQILNLFLLHETREGAEFRIDVLRTLRFLDLSSEKRNLQASECVVQPFIINKLRYLCLSLVVKNSFVKRRLLHGAQLCLREGMGLLCPKPVNNLDISMFLFCRYNYVYFPKKTTFFELIVSRT